jgi:site-specific DNA-methyltransferase (adenine-specific)
LSEFSIRLAWDSKTSHAPVNDKDFDHHIIEIVHPYAAGDRDSIFELFLPESLPPKDNKPSGRIFQGDNLQVMQFLLHSGYGKAFDLIYIDPPYLSSNTYHSRVKFKAAEDRPWEYISRPVFVDPGFADIEQYLDHLYPRLCLMKELLSVQGSLLVHLDWHVSHYVKILLDEIFSPHNLVNEIVWCYSGGSGTKRHFHRKHDLILWYAKSDEYIFNPQYRPYTAATRERGLTKVKGDKYKLHSQGALMQDWWTDINKILSPTAAENLKFPTQKPEALLRRIILSASSPGSLVADFYAGSGTTAAISQQLERCWLSCDNSPIAIQTSIKRLIKQGLGSFAVEHLGPPLQANTGSLRLMDPLIQPYDHDYALILIGIEDYKPDSRHIQDLQENWHFGSVIDFWEVDLDYDGETFYSQVQILRNKKHYDSSLQLSIKLKLPLQDTYRIAIRVYDLFGDSQMESLLVEAGSRGR